MSKIINEEDSFKVLASPCEGLYKEKSSKFIALLFPVCTETEAMQRLQDVKALHPKARHYCFAFRLGMWGEHYRANDDGEPSGTAGKPILGQLIKNEVSDVMAIVVRYFGGTLLGASGLIHAYRESTADALKEAELKEKVLTDTFRISFNYARMPMVMEGVKKLDLEILEQHFTEFPEIKVAIRKSRATTVIPQLKSIVTGRSVEEVGEKNIENLKIELLTSG